MNDDELMRQLRKLGATVDGQPPTVAKTICHADIEGLCEWERCPMAVRSVEELCDLPLPSKAAGGTDGR